jgi:hypothetical protein
LRNAAINAAAADPDLSPLDFLLALMRDQNVPLETRVTAAHETLPYMHSRERDAAGNQPHPGKYGVPISRVNVNKGSSPDDRKVERDKEETDKRDSGPGNMEDDRGRVGKKATEAADERGSGQDVSPLDFLLGVMRDRDAAPHLRFKVASIIAPYLHPKRKTTSAESDALSGFNIDFPTAKALRDDEDRYKRLYPYETSPEGIDLAARIATIKKDLTYPTGYGTRDVNQDSRRLGELSERRRLGPKLTQKEDAERAILNARLAAFKGTPEAEKWALDRERIWRLTYKKKFQPDVFTDQQETELQSLKALYPNLSHEPDDHGQRIMMSFGEQTSANLAKARRSLQAGHHYGQPKTG